MAKAVALHIGLNRIDPKHYGTEGLLAGCVNDARAMEAIAASRGFTTTVLLDAQASAQGVLGWLETAARSAASGDSVIVTYAGHGSQVADTNNPPEPDGKDETWCLYDRMLVDDELARCWSRFAAGVRILLISDSCHSATIARTLELLSASMSVATRGAGSVDLPLIGRAFGSDDVIRKYRVLPDEFPTRAERAYPGIYREIQERGPGSEDIPIAATVLSMSACQDDETAGDGSRHGVFTQALLDSWANGAFRGTHAQFFAAIKRAITVGRQVPEYRITGTPSPTFETETPFSHSLTGRMSKEQVMNSEDNTIEQRFEAIARRGNGSRQHTDIVSDHDFCRMQLLVPREAVIGRTDQEVADFLEVNGLPTLIKGFLAASSVKVTARPIEGGISCSADTKGNAGCKAEVSIRF